MAINFLFRIALACTLLIVSNASLVVNFYKDACPGVEDLVREEMKAIQKEDPTLMPALLRLHFHDCFVRGCDASVLLNSLNGTAEKDAAPNLSLRGFNAIDRIKATLEFACPGIVSCADILAIAARDAVFLSNGPDYDVETGRRDGNTSSAEEALLNLPPAYGNITELIDLYTEKNLTVKDLVVLSGAHTFGVSHCTSFSDRLYNYTGKGDQDPSLDSTYAEQLKQECPVGDNTTVVAMVPGNWLNFDGSYYGGVLKNEGLFAADAALLDSRWIRAYMVAVNKANSKKAFFVDFGVSMIHMGRIEPLTGTNGTIRAVCSSYVE